MSNHRRRQQTADLLAVLAEAVKAVSESDVAPLAAAKRRKPRNGRSRRSKCPSRSLPIELLAAIVHNHLLDTDDRASLRLVCEDWRAAHDSLVKALVCHSVPSHLPSRFPLLRRLDLSFIDKSTLDQPSDISCLESVLKLAPCLPILQRLVVTYRQLVGRDVALGRDRVELVQVGFRSHPARSAAAIGALLQPLTQLRDLLVYSHEDHNYPSTLAIYHRYPPSALPPTPPCATPPAPPTPSMPTSMAAAAPAPHDAAPTVAAAAAAAASGEPRAHARGRRGRRAQLDSDAAEAVEAEAAGGVAAGGGGAGPGYSCKWLSHLGVLLPPQIGPYSASCIHLHTAPSCQDYILAEDLLHAPPADVAALPPATWQASRGWCTLLVLDLNYCTITSWPPEWLALPLLTYVNVSPYNSTPHLPLPALALPPALPLLSLALRSFATHPLLPSLPFLPSLHSLTLTHSSLATLPPALSTLTQLTHLSVAENHLSDDIAPVLASLPSLRDLDLSGNVLTCLPRSISALTALTRLKIIECNTWAVEDGLLGQLTNLEVLDMCGDRMASLPPDTTQLRSLRSLRLRSVSLVTLPPMVGALSLLHSLDLYCNWLSTLPDSFSSLQALTALDLGHNFIEALPPSLLALTGLSTLSLAYNRLSTLPPEISHLSNLASLDISFNPMRTLPPALSTLPTLDTLVAQGLLAPLPFFLASAPCLMAMDLTADGLDLRWPQAIPPQDFQDKVADPLLALARRAPRPTILSDREFVARLRQAWVRAGAQPPFPKMAQIPWDAVEIWEEL